MPTTYTYKTAADCRIKADVYPPSGNSGPKGTLVFIHGGCLIFGSRKGINPRQLKLYAGAGYAVVSIDYRLAPETKLPGIVEDIEDAIRWVREARADPSLADPEPLAVVGHSAGGYLTLMAGCRVVPRPRALIAFYEYGDLLSDCFTQPDDFYRHQAAVSEEESGFPESGPVISEPYEGRGKDKLYLYCRQRGLWPLAIGGHDSEAVPDFFTPYCPVMNVGADYPPTLLLHGDQDTDVPYAQSVRMAAELSRHNVPHELVTIADGPHGFDREMDNPQVTDAFAKVLDFLGTHM